MLCGVIVGSRCGLMIMKWSRGVEALSGRYDPRACVE